MADCLITVKGARERGCFIGKMYKLIRTWCVQEDVLWDSQTMLGGWVIRCCRVLANSGGPMSECSHKGGVLS